MQLNQFDDTLELEPILLECPNCGEMTIVCKSERVCVNQPFGPPLPENERVYEWTHTSACNTIKRLKTKLDVLK